MINIIRVSKAEADAISEQYPDTLIVRTCVSPR